MDRIIEVDGWWVPHKHDQKWKIHAERAERDLPMPLRHCTQKRTAIQAGGNVGAWAVALAKQFENVITFEPDELNFRCLHRNCERYKNIERRNEALGEREGMMTLVDGGNPDSHYMSVEAGSTRVVSIDSLYITDLDYVELDIEGFEYYAILGGINTINDCRPVLQIEEKGNGRKKGDGFDLHDIMDVLTEYKILGKTGKYDYVLVPEEKC